MSVENNTNIVVDNLVFSFDVGSLTSYDGPAIRNAATEITAQYNSNSALFYMVPGVERVYIPTLGYADVSYTDMYNDYNGGSGSCCPSPYRYGNGIPVTGSTLYTYAILYKSVNRYTHPNYMYHYEYNSSGTYLVEYGVHSTGSEIHLGDGWYWAYNTFTTQPTAATINTGCWMYQYATWNRLYIAEVLIAAGNYTGVHPRYWPTVGTTRSSTTTLRDVTRNGTINLNSVNYASDGSLSFNGSGNYITYTPNSRFPLHCLDIWFYNNNAIPNNDTSIGGPTTYQSLVQFNGANTLGVNLGAWTGSMTNEAIHIWTYNPASTYSATYNQTAAAVGWHNVVFNWNGGYYDIWLDGVKTTVFAQTSNGHSLLQEITSSIRFGGNVNDNYYFNGRIAAAKAYNRSLSDTEVRNNFNALRGRYGI